MSKTNKNKVLDEKFNVLDESKKLELLCITEDTFTLPRFKGIDKNIVINDLWSAQTNSEKRCALKTL